MFLKALEICLIVPSHDNTEVATGLPACLLPIFIVDAPWWTILIGFVVMHYTAGLILSLVFQLAHVIEDAEMPKPDTSGTMKNTWAIHQLLTTVNFSTKSKDEGF